MRCHGFWVIQTCVYVLSGCVQHVCSAACPPPAARPPVGALILLQPGPLSCVRSATTGRQRHIFRSGGH